MPQPRAIILVGLPAAGKTTYALSGRFPGFSYISPELFPGMHRSVRMNKMRNMIMHAIYEDRDFIVDDCNPTYDDRKFYLDVFNHCSDYCTNRTGYIPYMKECHHLQTTMKQAKDNASSRRDQGGDRISRAGLICCTQFMSEPSKSEGFHSIVNVDFVFQEKTPGTRAVFFSLDGVIRPIGNRRAPLFRQTKKQVMLNGNRNHVFRWYHDEGYKFIGITHLAEVADGRTPEATAQACILEIVRQLKVPIDAVFYCPHRKEAQCYCFPPSTYFAEWASEQHRINLQKSIMVGSGNNPIEQVFAEKAGIGSYVSGTTFYNREKSMMVR